jgi:hypothetical protein
MGLTIHYTLALPGKPSLVSVKSTIGALRQKCLDLPFQEVGELLDLDGDACDPEKQQDQSLRWFLIQAGVFTHFDFDSRGKPRKADQLNREVHTFKVPAARIIGFTTYPGPGCEMANVGLRLTPKTVKIPAIGDHDSGELKLSGGWGWSSFCKTQYASSSIEGGSLENFLRCHLAVVAMLDDARELGFETSVSDEGGFYDSRNLDALCKNLESYMVRGKSKGKSAAAKSKRGQGRPKGSSAAKRDPGRPAKSGNAGLVGINSVVEKMIAQKTGDVLRNALAALKQATRALEKAL